MADVYDFRLHRAEILEKEWPFSAELLQFWRKVWAVQKERIPAESLVLRIAALIRQDGPPALAQHLAAITDLEAALSRYADGEASENPVPELLYRILKEREYIDLRSRGSSVTCARCADGPGVSVLREDKGAETVRRSLICSQCSHERDFPRVLCPACNEENPDKLPRYTAHGVPWMRVEACDTCKKYIKSVDLTLNWDADPIVDELASTPLDVIAREHGYVKIAPNLAGI